MIDPTFQGFNRHFALTFKNNTYRTTHTWYFHPVVEINHYNVIIAGLSSCHQPIKIDVRIHENIKKCWGSRICLLDYSYFKEQYKLVTID